MFTDTVIYLDALSYALPCSPLREAVPFSQCVCVYAGGRNKYFLIWFVNIW